MLKVIVCEDNIRQLEQIKKVVESTIQDNLLDLDISLCTDNPESVIAYLEQNKTEVRIYFLDIELNSKINGLTLAQFIRKYDPDGYIIFITTHSELACMTFEYKVEAMGFIPKDEVLLLNNKIRDNLLEAYNKYNNKFHCETEDESKYITIETGGKKVNIKLEDILFFETVTAGHKIRIHTIKKQIEYYGTIKSLKDKLNDNFYQSHRSYLVNMQNIKEIDKKRLLIRMKNYGECYVSIRKLTGLVRAWRG
ncbi:LytTR family DNA-binding domain-containing protein [Clostridium sp. CS001]|uniref:LytR/AlgR family response regulator transcription factor n=1 Tax=Clostridium sp. CS001 TaxID=2880648 RepID=UPI001CF55253|nr:LytTR family DNA-binding domain-containing protein [Clostridium sp. CS001]MCB2291742.1 LytTR family DNA-binding domain-containing protein [Clostridium sp. CS001]